MNLRALWASAQRWYAAHSARDRRILLGVGLAAVASLLYVGVVDPLLAYRKRVGEEISEDIEELERSAHFLAAADSLRAERTQLQKRLDEAKSRLLPGDSGTLGAAALQERANAIAAAKGITVQSTQVMREETADPFRKISVRLTISGELKPFADFVSSLEYGPQQLNLPFVELSRRGAVAGAKGPRTLSATVEVSGYLRGATEKEGKAEETPPVEAETPPGEGETASPPGEGEANPEAAAKPAPGGAGGEAVAVPAPVAPFPPPGAEPAVPPPGSPPPGQGEAMPAPGAAPPPVPSPAPAPGAAPPPAVPPSAVQPVPAPPAAAPPAPPAALPVPLPSPSAVQPVPLPSPTIPPVAAPVENAPTAPMPPKGFD